MSRQRLNSRQYSRALGRLRFFYLPEPPAPPPEPPKPEVGA